MTGEWRLMWNSKSCSTKIFSLGWRLLSRRSRVIICRHWQDIFPTSWTQCYWVFPEKSKNWSTSMHWATQQIWFWYSSLLAEPQFCSYARNLLTISSPKALPLSPDVKKINPNGVAALAKDVDYLAEFVDSLENAPILRENLDELQQTITLMQTDNPDEFFDVATRNKKFGRVDAMNGPRILEKYYLWDLFLWPSC